VKLKDPSLLRLLALQDTTGRHPQSSRPGARRIFARFVFVAVAINALFASGLVVFDILDANRITQERLGEQARAVIRAHRLLRSTRPELSDLDVLLRVRALTGAHLALLNASQAVRNTTHPKIAAELARVFPKSMERNKLYVEVEHDMGDLSGAWLSSRSAGQSLIVIIEHRPEDEGHFKYMTFGAAVLGAGLALSVLLLLASANWVLYRPIQRLVDKLTGALAHDIQRRREAEKHAIAARGAAEELLTFRENLLDASDAVGIIATDTGGIVRVYNRAAQDILGHQENAVSGVLELSALRERGQREPEEALPPEARIKPTAGEELFVDAQGQERLLASSLSEIRDSEGNTSGELWTFIDVSERRRLEAELHQNELQLIQSAKMASLGEMATGIAHELNQPLNNIGLLTARVLRRLAKQTNGEQTTPPQEVSTFAREKLDRVLSQVERAGRIIEQLRTFGRPTDNAPLHAVPLKKPVEHVKEMLKGQFRRRQIALTVDVSEDLPAARANQGHLEQVLLNLLINAMDAFEDGAREDGWQPSSPPKVQLSAYCQEREEGRMVALSVTDNGPGMSDETRARIFQPFFSTKEVGRGTGLGLSISYGLIEAFGGTLSVESSLGEGASFTILLEVGEDAATVEDPADR